MADEAHVQLVRSQISTFGVSVYLAEHDPQPGTSVAKKVKDAIQRADIVVVLLSERGINSNYVQQEIGVALSEDKIVVPIVDRSVDHSRLGMLAEVEWIEVDLNDPADAMATLSRGLGPLISRQIAHKRKAAQAAEAELLVGVGLLLLGLWVLARS